MIIERDRPSVDTVERALVSARPGPGPDPVINWLTAVLVTAGVFVIFDAGFARSIQKGDGLVPGEFKSQVIFGLLAALIAYAVSRVPGNVWRRLSLPIFAVSMLGLVAVKIFGQEMNGAQRWLKIGPIQVQPAEFMKIAAIVFVASVLADRKPWRRAKTTDWAQWLDRVAVLKFVRLLPMFAILAAVLLIELEPDLGTAAVIGATGYFMFLFGGITTKSKLWVSAIALLLVGGLVLKSPFRMERVTNHVHRWEADRIDDVGYQTVQSEIAMASGGLVGTGPGSGRVKHLMPAATTDFVFATVAEETGLLGVMAILSLVGALVWRIWLQALRCRNAFAQNLCFGVAIWLTIQATVNLMMANGFLPPIGIPFPFISSGGSSLIALLIGVALCQSASRMREAA
ncbi:MAG: FtsW/RodA/SpoVE family cell cycle protein [Fimbriimonadaceae bacterium]|nr:FtsW/RodA/SpoVE family cell cycle protein [Fimbriimonadaceae bacterium]